MEGAWTIYVCTGCGLPTGRHKDCDALREATPVVPCDDAAVERVARAIRAENLHLSLPTCFERARGYLRAAGETP